MPKQKPKNMVSIKKEAGVGSSPSIASLSNIDIYTIWGMMGKPISRGGIIWRRPKQHIRYYGVFLLVLIIVFFIFPLSTFEQAQSSCPDLLEKEISKVTIT